MKDDKKKKKKYDKCFPSSFVALKNNITQIKNVMILYFIGHTLSCTGIHLTKIRKKQEIICKNEENLLLLLGQTEHLPFDSSLYTEQWKKRKHIRRPNFKPLKQTDKDYNFFQSVIKVKAD